MKCEQIQNVVTEGAAVTRSYSGNDKGFRNSVPGTGDRDQMYIPFYITMSSGVLEDGATSNGVPRSTAPSGTSNPEKKMSCGTQCPNPQSLSSGPLAQKQNGLRTAEAKRDTKRTSAKEVTINVADSIRQVDRSRRITKNCIN
ncbi:hypothetical protein FD755_016723 [Muntiacus reevesi]|uniref:Brain and acute leukemia cytoplasmic protein n=1 Tax=Muntiacus reevesi TaxID=9886 RepID=A0A5N3XFA0_MUNRE|nr:hypothetical protein FD755_016723 [Muntiacus reevesi]